MEQGTVSRYFLGANTGGGFFSLYDGFTDPLAGDFLHVIKGGPGCGKSTLMRRVGAAAEAAGLPVEYVHCSGDPDSLDAVWLPTRRVGYVDGTAPHVIEAVYPGAAADYLDMSRFLDSAALRPALAEIADITRRYQAQYALAYRQLAAAVALLPRNLPGLGDNGAAVRAARRAGGLARRLLPPLGKPGTARRRFLTSVSCQGCLRQVETLERYPRRLLLENALGLGQVYLETLSRAALARGYDAVLCPDPLEPERLEALLLPEAELAVLAVDPVLGGAVPEGRHLRLDGLVRAEVSHGLRPLLRQRKRESAEVLAAAVDTLARAKALHDELEAVYRGHVDFAGADALAEREIARSVLG